uniref:Cytochrome P450 n=1 Tax=Oryza brachyantha TaxID=4533 RepID=J3LD20_ORYBR
MVLGKKYIVEGADPAAAAAATPEQFRWMIEEIFFLNGVFNVGDMVPWLAWLDPQGYIGRMKRLGKMFDRFLEDVLEEHDERRRRGGAAVVAADMVDLLLQFADDPNLKVPIQRDGVKAFIPELITGSTDTSSVSVEWAMSEVLRTPRVLAKVTEELDRVVGRGRLVAEADIASLPYLEAVVKESMRLHPVVPLLVPRVSREDASVAGYDVPAGTRVLVNVWAIGRDPAMVHLALANLLHAFAWRLPGGMAPEELSVEEKFGISVSRKLQLEAIPEPRLPAHLYYDDHDGGHTH